MKRPDQRHRKRQSPGLPGPKRPAGRQGKRPTHQGEQRHGRRQMDQDVHEVVAPDVQTADGVRQRQRQVQDRPTFHRLARRRLQHRADPTEVADRVVVGNGADVVQNEWPPKAIGVGDHDGDYHQDVGAVEQPPPARCPGLNALEGVAVVQ